MVDDVIAAHERRIRTVQSIRVPPGVRPPQVDPVPAELLQRGAGLWNAMQQATWTSGRCRAQGWKKQNAKLIAVS